MEISVRAADMDGEFKEIITDMAEEWKGLTDEGWCGVSLNNRFMITLGDQPLQEEGRLGDDP